MITAMGILIYLGGFSVAWDHAREVLGYRRIKVLEYALTWPYRLGECLATMTLYGRWERSDKP